MIMFGKMIYSYKDTLQLFKKENAHLLFYSWFDMTVAAYKNCFLYLFPLYAVSLFFYYYAAHHADDVRLAGAGHVVDFLLLFFTILLVRPSVEQKNYAYLAAKTYTCFIPALYVYYSIQFVMPSVQSLYFLFSRGTFLNNISSYVVPFLIFIIHVIRALALFCIADVQGAWRHVLSVSISCALKISFFNAPLFCIGYAGYLFFTSQTLFFTFGMACVGLSIVLLPMSPYLLLILWFMFKPLIYLYAVYTVSMPRWWQSLYQKVDFKSLFSFFSVDLFYKFYKHDQQLYQQAVQFHNLFSTVLLPLLLSLLAVLYIKRVHDQCEFSVNVQK